MEGGREHGPRVAGGLSRPWMNSCPEPSCGRQRWRYLHASVLFLAGGKASGTEEVCLSVPYWGREHGACIVVELSVGRLVISPESWNGAKREKAFDHGGGGRSSFAEKQFPPTPFKGAFKQTMYPFFLLSCQLFTKQFYHWFLHRRIHKPSRLPPCQAQGQGGQVTQH